MSLDHRAFSRVLALPFFGALALACGVEHASAPPAAPPALTLLTLNIAQGATDLYRTPEHHQREAEFVADAGAQLVALQEVDRFVPRSGRADVAAVIAGADCAAAPYSADGLERCDSPQGTVLFAIGFCGADEYGARVRQWPAESCYGNAVLAAPGLRVSEAYAVTLPTDPAQQADDPLFGELANGPVDEQLRARLGAANLALRNGAIIEPRVALVVRLERPDARPLTVIATHLQYAGLDAVRALQLARLAALARAERAAGRDVVVLGDFNMDPSEARPVLEGVGMAPAAGTGQGDDAALDQIWVDARLTLLSSELVPTLGVSDHEWAGRAEVR